MTKRVPYLPEASGSHNAALPHLAMLGGVAATTGLLAWLAWPGRRSNAPGRRALVAYLHEHLAGSEVAAQVVQRLACTQRSDADRALFRRFSAELEEDRTVLRALLRWVGASERSAKRATGYVSGAVLRMIAGGNPGDLSLLRTLEGLSIGVQGKRCLWRTLQVIRPYSAALHAVDFGALEMKAVRQWEVIEERRRALVARTFGTTNYPTE